MSAIFDIDSFGVNTSPGITQFDGIIQDAYTAAIKNGGGTVTYGPGPYLCKNPLDFTWKAGGGAPPVIFKCLAPSFNPTQGILIGHNSIGIDATGNDTLVCEDLTLTTEFTTITEATLPTIGILLARSTASEAHFNKLIRPRITGYFRNTGLYDYGCENFSLDNGTFTNYFAGGRCAVFTANNIGQVESIQPGLIDTKPASTTIIDVTKTAWQMPYGNTTSDCVYLEGVAGYHQWGGIGVNYGGRAIFYMDNTTNTPTGNVDIQAFRMDQGGGSLVQAQYGMLFGAATSRQIHTGWRIEGVHFNTSVAAIAAVDANTWIDGFYLNANSEASSKGINIPGRVQGFSNLRLGAMITKFGELAEYSYLEGYQPNWTIGSTDNTCTQMAIGKGII